MHKLQYLDMAIETRLPVDTGDRAPDFQLYTDEGEAWTLSEHLDRPVVLLFFPGAFTSVCTSELNRVNNDPDTFDGTHVVGISTNSPSALSEFRSKHGFEFPLLSDHDAEVCAQYGSKYEGNFGPMDLERVAKRSAFVVDGEGVVRYAEVLDDAGNQPDFDAIRRTVENLQA